MSINHPNGYFDESVKVLKNIKTGEKNEIQTRLVEMKLRL